MREIEKQREEKQTCGIVETLTNKNVLTKDIKCIDEESTKGQRAKIIRANYQPYWMNR